MSPDRPAESPRDEVPMELDTPIVFPTDKPEIPMTGQHRPELPLLVQVHLSKLTIMVLLPDRYV